MPSRRHRGHGSNRSPSTDAEDQGSRSRDVKRESMPSRSRDRAEAGGQHPGAGMRDRSPRDRAQNVEQQIAKMQEDSAAWNQAADPSKKRFTGRCRLFVGNLPVDMKEEQLREMFTRFGEINECYLSGKGFGFVRLDTRAHAEVAKEELDGFLMKNRPIRVRFAVHGAAVKVKGLSTMVSNELLQQAFSMFGVVERAVHIVDERGRPTGEGIVEFERKPAALDALRRINDGVFLLTTNPKPLVAEPLDPKDDDDGLVERMLNKNPHYHKERSQPPRFALPGTFECDFGNRWKELYQVERMKRDQLEQELKEGRDRLENDMELAFQEYQAAVLREDLKRRQEELDRLDAARRERLEMIRRQDEERFRNVNNMQPPQQSAGPPMMPGMFQGGFGRMNNMVNANQQQQQLPPQFSNANRRDGGNMNPHQQPRDDNLVHGVQKLLQMFKSEPNPGFPPPHGGMPPQNMGLLGHQPTGDQFFMGGGNMGMGMGMGEPHPRDRDQRQAPFDPSRRHH